LIGKPKGFFPFPLWIGICRGGNEAKGKRIYLIWGMKKTCQNLEVFGSLLGLFNLEFLLPTKVFSLSSSEAPEKIRMILSIE